MGYLGATLTQVFTRAGGADVSLRDIIIAQMGNGARECGWRHAPEARGGFGGFWKSQLSWVLPREKTVGFRLLATRVGGCRWKSQNRKNVYLSPFVKEPLNSKVIKSFVTKLRSRYVFFVFRDSYVLCIYVMNILCTFRVAISWLCNKIIFKKVQQVLHI